MRQVVSMMKQETLLDYAVFRLTPTRTRCELLVSDGSFEEKLVDTSLLKPYCLHLQAAAEQFTQGCYSIRLELPIGDGGSRQRTWFTKGTMERFVRFVSTPEVLERVSIIDHELTKLDEALNENPQFDNTSVTLISSSPLTVIAGGNTLSGLQGDKATNYAKLRFTTMDVDSISTVENARCGLLKAMEARKYMLQKEQGMAFARAAAAGFNMDHISDILAFSECFGARRLQDACIKYLALYKRKQDAGVWAEEMELPTSEAALTHPDHGHGAYGNNKAASETWSDIHCEVGGQKLEEVVQGSIGFETFKSTTIGAGNSEFSGYAHDSLPGFSTNMSSIAYSSSPFEAHGQNRLYSNAHFPQLGHEAFPVNHGHPGAGMLTQLGSAGYVRGPGMLPSAEGVTPASQMHFLMQPPPYPSNHLEPYDDLKMRLATSHGSLLAQEFNGAYNSEIFCQNHDGIFQENGYQIHHVHSENSNILYMPHNQSVHGPTTREMQARREEKSYYQANMLSCNDLRNVHLHSGTAGGKLDERSSDDSLSHAVASDADAPIDHKMVSPIQNNAPANAESEGSTSAKKRPSSKKLQVGRASGKHSGIVVIKNINYITSNTQNDGTPGSSVIKNAETGDSDDDVESPENDVREPGVAKQDRNLYLSNQDASSDCDGKLTVDDTFFPNKERDREVGQSRSKNSKKLEISEDQEVLDQQKYKNFTISKRSGSNATSSHLFDSEAFHENQIVDKPNIVISEDPQFLTDGDHKLQRKIAPEYGLLEGMERNSHSNIRTLNFDSEIMLLPTREIKNRFQNLKEPTELESHHDQNGFLNQRADQTSDSFIVPERRGRLDAGSFGNHITECIKDTRQTQKHKLVEVNDSFFVPARSESVKQTNTSWKSTFNMEAELPSDGHENTAKDEKTDRKNVDSSMGFDDLILIPERNFIRETINRSWENPSDSDVNLLGSTCNATNLNDVDIKEKLEEILRKRDTESGSKKVTKTSDLLGENGKLTKKTLPIAARGCKSSSKSVETPSRSGATWTSKMTNPLKSKREKEEAERKRLEDLKLQRQERISARSNSSGITKSVTLTSRVSKSLSLGSKPLTPPHLPTSGRLRPLTKATDSSPISSNQRSHPGHSISGEKWLDRSHSSLLKLKKQNVKPLCA